MFSPDFEKHFCYADPFLENQKNGNHFLLGLVNMMDEVEQICLNLIFFPCMILAECSLVLSWRSTMFLLLMTVGCFL